MPLYIVLIANVIIFVLIFRVLIRNRLRQRKRFVAEGANSKTVLKVNIRLAVSVFSVSSVFGLGWIFGVFIIRDAAPFFRYVFVICNAYQGVLFSILIIIIGMDGRKFWTQLFNRSQSSVNEMVVLPQSGKNTLVRQEKPNTSDKDTTQDTDRSAHEGKYETKNMASEMSTLFCNEDTTRADSSLKVAAMEDVEIVISYT